MDIVSATNTQHLSKAGTGFVPEATRLTRPFTVTQL